MYHAISGQKLKALDLITYEMNFIVKKIREMRNSRDMSKDEFISQMQLWSNQMGDNCDKLEDYVNSLTQEG